MEAALEKIRPHTTSKLLHQKKPADLLVALESTFDEQKTERSPTAYFAALLTTLEGTVQKQDLGLDDGDVLPAELYLLALVSPFVPPPVIRSHLSTILTIAGPLFSILTTHAPPLRSEITLFENVIIALERSQLDAHGIRQIFASILQLSLDSRPKVRRKAAEVIRNILNSPPPPLMYHPYAKIVADWAIEALAITNTGTIPRAKGKKADASFSDTFLHLLSCIRPILSKFPAEALPSITTSLLSLPRLGNPFLSQLAYSLLADLFGSASAAEETNLLTQIPAVLHAVLSSPPSKSDPTLPSAWVHLLGVTMLAYHSYDTNACATELPKVWRAVWNWMESSDLAIRSTTAASLGLLIKCIPPASVETAIQESSVSEEPKVLVNRIVKQLIGALDAINYARAIPQVFEVISLLITHLRKDASEKLLGPTIQKIALLRVNKSFEHKESADATLSISMRVLGPQILLRHVPLNLEPSDRNAGREPHAFLLPMLAQPHPSPLSHFLEYFVPLSERMFELEQKAEAEGRASEAKVWNVLIDQVWSGFVGYCWCHGTPKLQNELTPAFSQLLSQILYSQPELRPTVLKALKVLVESNVSIASSASQNTDVDTITREEAAANVAFLRTQSESWLSVLFNVFSNMDRNSRNLVGDVITPWASIAGEQEIVNAYRKVVALFKSHLQSTASQRGPAEAGSPASTMQDIILLLLPYLGITDAHELFKACLSREVLASEDSGVQKRGYKILSKLLESGKVDDIDTEAAIKELDSMVDSLSAAAKKDRVLVLARLVPKLPPTMLHTIPTLIPEAVLGTKEPSEKARSAAFDLIVIMGRKMGDGGVVKRNLLEGMDEDGEASEGPAEVSASVEEYFTMIAGGLVGATPHMISATITAISRLLFEFKDRISENMQKEILTTLLVFVNSNNREIVKSALGFIKLAIHTLSVALLTPFLKDIVPGLLSWSHNHNNHFKVKVRHILERMIRRFGFEAVYQCAGEDEAGKVLLNIKKRKDRMKRKKAQQGEDNDDDDEHEVKPKAGDAFEDVLYGSESELEDSDEEGEQNQKPAGKNNKKSSGGKFGARLRIDDEEPMDLLHGAASHITNAQTNKRRKPGQDAAHFKVDEDTGKMIIDEQDSEDEDDGHTGAQKDAAANIAGAAYHEAQISVDGFVRGQGGHVKFHRDTKKRRREELENTIEDVEMADGEGAGKKKVPRKRQDAKLGHEFKAKKAGGDVKKGGVDPYAYLSLSTAAKKGKGRLGVASKK